MNAHDGGSGGSGWIALRIARRHWKRMAFFACCIAVGVSFLVSISSLVAVLNQSVESRARELLAADLELSAYRPISDEVAATVQSLAPQGTRDTTVVSFPTMLRKDEDGAVPFLVRVRAIEKTYPLYGAFALEPSETPQQFENTDSCWLDATAAAAHDLRIGDVVWVGEARARIAALVHKEPDAALTDFSFAPRLYIPAALLDATKLVQFGSRIQYSWMLALPDSRYPLQAAQEFRGRLEGALTDPYVRVNDFGRAQSNVSDGMERVAEFFLLVSLVTVVMGVVGMASSVGAFFNEQLDTVGTLRCLGVEEGGIARIYQALCLGFGVLGGLLGCIGGVALHQAVLYVARRWVGLHAPDADFVYWPSLVEGFALACVLSVGVNLPRIRALSRVTPLDVVRGHAEAVKLSKTAVVLLVLGSIGALAGYTYWKTLDWETAAFFSMALVGSQAAGLILILLGLAFVRRMEKWFMGGAWAFYGRHGLRQVVRNRARTLLFLATLATGFTLLASLHFVQHSLVRELLAGDRETVPDVFIMDVQKEQIAGVKQAIDKYAKSGGELTPLIRARMTHYNGGKIQRQNLDALSSGERRAYRTRTREFNLTYKDGLNDSESIVAGALWPDGSTEAQFSVEEGFAERAGFTLGDLLRFEVQGRPVEGKVTSLRRVNWMSMRPNFFVVMPTHALSEAPQTLIASLEIRDEEQIAEFQRELAGLFPNVSVINVRSIIASVQEMLGYLLTALKTLGWFCVGVGLLVMAGTVSMGRHERMDAAALMRTMGLTTRQLVWLDAVEFAVVGVLTVAVSSVVSVALAWRIAAHMKVEFSPSWIAALPLVACALCIPPVVGLLANRATYGTGVMDNLRRESR